MAGKVLMTAKTVFANDRVTVFPKDGPAEGVTGRAVQAGDAFETDLDHAKDLKRLGHAVPDNDADLEQEPDFLEPHHTVSERQLRERYTAVTARRGLKDDGTSASTAVTSGRTAKSAG